MTQKPKDISTGSVCYAHVAFEEDATQGKSRPIAVLMEVTSEVHQGTGAKPSDTEYLCYPITSQKPKEKYEELYYEITDYTTCGLKKTSYIKCRPQARVIIPESGMDYKGELSSHDLVNFLTKVSELRALKKEA